MDRMRLGAMVLGMGLVALSSALRADGPADNIAEKVRRIPRLGIEVPQDKRDRLTRELADLEKAIATLQKSKERKVQSLLPDVRIYWQAVYNALTYQEFFTLKEVDAAFDLLEEGRERAAQLAKGQAPWATATGLVVRGYISRIDGSVQPYGLVIPETYAPGGRGCRLDVWLHGRGETLSEVNFLSQRRRVVGTFAPRNTIVLHPYGRYSNANKLAGEIDVLEGMASVQDRYAIDPNRIAVRGFSMGGASTWQLATHYPGLWAAANPGAGFSETPEFLKFFQKETLDPPWYEKKLWRMYDCTDWAVNLYNCPTVAYSGELDIQKQAADIMEKALERENIDLVHIIGPGTKHAYHPQAREEVDRRIASIVEKGRQRVPRTLHFVTYTLRYNQVAWLTIDALGEHWEQARVDGQLGDNKVSLKTRNVTAFTLSMDPGYCPFDIQNPVTVHIGDQQLIAPFPKSDRSWTASFHLEGNGWQQGPLPGDGLRKQHLLQGPIDDAFLDSFIFVRPTGKCRSEKVDAWTRAEMTRAIEQWRRHFRGHPRIKDDTAITDADIASMNLVLWGDPSANKVLARLADRLPIRYQVDSLVAGGQRFAAEDHAPIMIYPNPVNPRRYVVLNSSFTFREYAYLNNARQTPKLPDWAIVDVRTPPNPLWPGKIVAADFFDEQWKLKPSR